MNKSVNSNTYTIDQVANMEHDGRIEIPALQRGLVWSPHQVELLWDSILRGFPIGAFALTPVGGNESQRAGADMEATPTQYFLLDGQQRYNAIKAAFTPWSDNAPSVLWIDFMPPIVQGSTRRFWIKVITKAHPWGFANNDSCSVLGWRDYRKALKRFTDNEDSRVQEVQMSQAWPFKARCPVPFADVMKAFNETKNDTEDCFCNKIISWCNNHKGIGCETHDYELIKHTARGIYNALARMQNYRIVANVLRPETLDDQDVIEDQNLSDDGTNSLEQLFTRINTLGTPISPYDLRYSAIKAYWGDIKNANDEIADTIMPAAHLAILAFRLALTLASAKDGFADTPSVQRIRSLKITNDPESKKICGIVSELYANNGTKLRNIINDVESALHVYKNDYDDESGLPAVIRTSIIQKSPDVYLLLLYMAYKGRLGDFGNISGLATWMHWFTICQQKVVADEIKAVVDNGDMSSLKGIIRKLCDKKSIFKPVEATEGNFLSPEKFLDDNGKTSKWQDFENEPWYEFFDRIWKQRELVIFATRRYFNREFRYDPAETKFLTGHNRPWDIDHIIPKSWVSRQGVKMGDWKNVCNEWIWSNGNYAAIPFTMNRSKGDSSDWGYYEDNVRRNELFFDENFCKMESDTITDDHDMAMLLIQTIHKRLIAMYEEWRKEIVEYL